LEAQWQLGLRVAEVTGLPVNAVDWDRAIIVVKGKSGKLRTVPTPPGYQPALRQGCHGKALTDKIFGGSPRSLQRTIAQISATLQIDAHGTHGLRYAYAQRRYQECLSQGLTDSESRQRISRELGHERLAITALYLEPE
jgi:integrase